MRVEGSYFDGSILGFLGMRLGGHPPSSYCSSVSRQLQLCPSQGSAAALLLTGAPTLPAKVL